MIELKGKNIMLFGEVKTSSPFGFNSNASWDEIFKLVENSKYVDVLSIHTDPRWKGSFDLIKKAKQLTKKPIMAKGIHATDEDVEKAIESGADYVLVVGRIPLIHLDKCIIEPINLEQLKNFNVEDNQKLAWNSRDLATGGKKSETFEEARRLWKGFLIQASNIKTIDDVKTGADAILVGSYLPEFLKSLEKTV